MRNSAKAPVLPSQAFRVETSLSTFVQLCKSEITIILHLVRHAAHVVDMGVSENRGP